MSEEEKTNRSKRQARLSTKAALWSEEGVSLVEALIAVAILGLALTALLSAMSTGSMATSRTEERVTAENLARSQLEYVKSQPYLPLSTPYATVTPYPDDYAVAVTSDLAPGAADGNIEKITVTISRGSKELLVVEDYKVNR